MQTVKHHFIGGVYCKELIIPDGHKAVSHKHKFTHMSVLAKGCAMVEVDGVETTHYAPEVLSIDAGKIHSVTAINGDVLWLCIHNIAGLDSSISSLDIDDQLIQDDSMVTPA